jgi:hypothetical protein
VREGQCGLLHHAPRVEHLGLAFDLGLKGRRDEAERVQVLELGANAELSLSAGAQRDVRVAAEVPALHVRVGDLDVAQHRAQRAQVGDRLLRRADVRLGDDLDQRNAGAIQIHVRDVPSHHGRVVDRLARVLLHVDAREAHARHLFPGVSPDGNVQPPLRGDGLFVLGDLVALGQIRIEVVLAGEDGAFVHGTVGGERRAHGELHRALVEYRQHARQGQADRMHAVIRRRAIAHRRGTEELGLGAQLRVHFETDHDLVVGMRAHRFSGGVRRWCSVTRS